MAPTLATTMLVPGAIVAPTPAPVMANVPVSLDVQAATGVTSATEPSEYVAVALKGIVTPTPTTGAVGVTAIDTKVAGVTVRFAVPATAPTAAEMVVTPGTTARARPPATVATLAFDELQVADVVMSWCVPSVSVAVAVKGTVP